MSEIRTAIPDEIDRYLDSLVRTGPFASKAELVRAALMAFASTAGPMARGFDMENIVAPDGRIYQLEYAREASMRGAPGVGVVYKSGVLLVGAITPASPLTKRVQKVNYIGDRAAILSSGIVSDARMLVRRAQAAEPQTTDELIDDLVSMYWEHTVERHKRPLCAALLVASVLDGEPRLLEIDPSGAVVEMKAAAIGMNCRKIAEALERDYRPGPAKEAEELALKALGKPEAFELVHLTA